MEWYMRRDGNEMIVPQDREQSEQSHSEDKSFHWQEGLSSMCGELPASTYGMWNSESKTVGDWLDYELDGLSEMDQMNDNFMSSFLEKDPPHMRNAYQSAGISSDSNCTRMPFDNFMEDMESQSISQHQSSRGNLKYLEVPSTVDWDKLDDSPTYTVYDSKKSKGSFTRNAPVNETSTSFLADGQVDETSLEETALQELNVAMIQMTDETRLSFRDALYRLAKSSSQQIQIQSPSGEHTNDGTSFSNVHRETSRSEKEEQMECETNYFDSTVAHLMFNDLNSNPGDLYQESPQRTHHNNFFV